MSRVVVGFGANPEITLRYDLQDSRQKVPAEISMRLAGTSVNVARNLGQWGHEVTLLAAIGIDCPYRDFLSREIENLGVRQLLLEAKVRTSMAVIDLREDGRSKIFSDKPPYLLDPSPAISESVKKIDPDFVLSTGVTPEEYSMVREMFDRAPKLAQRVLNPRHSLIVKKKLFEALLRDTSILAVNEDEFLTYTANHHVTFDDMARMHELGPSMVLVTRDARGAMLSIKDGVKIEQPVVRYGNAVDEVGAGDCFLAHFVHALSERMEMVNAMKFAAIAAGIKVTRIGGSNIPPREEIERSMHFAGGQD